jgi:hypothetical protein
MCTNIDEAYGVFGWDRNYLPTEDELSAKYRELMRLNHPDKVGAEGANLCSIINEARGLVRHLEKSAFPCMPSQT